jgi:hypothetical protein
MHGWVEQWQLGGAGYVLYQLLQRRRVERNRTIVSEY